MRNAVSLFPDGQFHSCWGSVSYLRGLIEDDIANGDLPEGMQVFRLPRRIVFNRYRCTGLVDGPDFDRICPKCKVAMCYHVNSGPCA